MAKFVLAWRICRWDGLPPADGVFPAAPRGRETYRRGEGPDVTEQRLVERWLGDMTREPILPAGAALVAGISGGGDSMALGAMLAAGRQHFRWRVTVVHVHHGLRGEEADQDAAFTESWAHRWGFPFVLRRADLGPADGRSFEMRARDARRAQLEAVARPQHGLIVLAHQREDQAETVLLRILRGTGVSGLAAMRPVMGRVRRPLLNYGRDDLRDMLRDLRIPWREDATNGDPAFVRNRLRRELLPLLQPEYNPRVVEALVRLARSAAMQEEWAGAEARTWYAAHALRDPDTGELTLEGAQSLPRGLSQRILRMAAEDMGLAVTEDQLDRAFSGHTVWPRHHTVESRGDDWVVVPPFAAVQWPEEPIPVLMPGRTPLPVGRLAVAGPETNGGDRRIRLDNEPRWARQWRPGDRIRLAAGTRKLQDLFVDQKVPRRLRTAWPVLTMERDGHDVLMLPGLAVDVQAEAGPGEPGWTVRWER
jgi:tRNA(Ile)-lysidine synthase